MRTPIDLRQTGYTLVELLLYVSIIGSLLMVVSTYFVSSTESRVKNQSMVEVNQQGALALEVITQTIRNAVSITSPTAGNSAASLTITVLTGADSPTIFDQACSATALCIKKGAASSVALTNSKVQISSLSFTNLTRTGAPGVIRVSFTISRVNPSNMNAYDYQKTFRATATLRDP